VTEFFFF